MSQSVSNNGIHCKSCNYEGRAKTNSTQLFIAFFILLSLSVFYLPLIVISLIYMAIVVARPAKKTCPECKSADVRDLTDEEAGINNAKPDIKTTIDDDKN